MKNFVNSVEALTKPLKKEVEGNTEPSSKEKVQRLSRKGVHYKLLVVEARSIQ